MTLNLLVPVHSPPRILPVCYKLCVVLIGWKDGEPRSQESKIILGVSSCITADCDMLTMYYYFLIPGENNRFHPVIPEIHE